MNQLSPQDPVPTLRGDLVLSARPTGAGAEVIQIRPVGYRDATRLHGFELSLARMLDGRRSAQDVVARANRIGLPLSLPALQGFIDHLGQHQLLARSRTEASSSHGPWSERAEWDPFVRQQYQAALKLLRAGKPVEARGALERLLSTAPLLDEARTLHAWLRDHPNGALDGETFTETFGKAERAWLKQRTPLRAREDLEPDELKAVRPSYVPYVVLALLIAAGLIGLLVPIPSSVSVPAQLMPVAEAPVMAPADGMVGEVQVKEGQTVNAGAPLLSWQDPQGAPLEAPVFGTVRGLAVDDGAQVIKGQQLLQLEDTRQLQVVAHVDARQAQTVKPGQSASISLGTARAKTYLTEVSGREVKAVVDNAGDVLEPGHAVLDIDTGPRSLLQRMR